RSESEYDPFGAAHSSTSISAALGFAIASKLSGAERKAIAVIGDGALSAGMAYEAMNNAEAAGNRLIVILNDNDMSIAPPVGSMRNALARLVSSGKYLTPRKLAQRLAPAENSADKYHGVVKFDVVSGVQAKAAAGAPSYTSVFGMALGAEMARDDKLVAITAAMPSGTGLDKVAEAFPDRTFDVGIAEQ